MPNKTGIARIVEDAAADLEPVSAAEQLDLLGITLPQTRRAAGRPVGRVNRRTERKAQYLLSRYPDPLEGLMCMANMGIEDMAAALNCSKLEAWIESRNCKTAILPYIHQKQAVAVDLTNRQNVYLSIGDGDEDGRQAANEDAVFEGAGLILAMQEAEPDASD